MNPTVIIVPTYNERDNLPRMAEKLLSLPTAVDILVVDDNSPDGTGKIADELAAKHPQFHVLHRLEKDGLGRAYIAGFKWALAQGYEFVFEMDCDFSHDPDEIPNFLKAAQKADLVLGSRYTGGVRVLNWPLKRLLLSRCAGIYVWLVTGMPFTDPTGGYKCFRREALQAIQLDAVKSNGYSFQIELTHRLWRDGFQVAEVPITFADRVEGTSKLSRHIVIEAFWMVWWLWLQNGLRRSPRQRRSGRAVNVSLEISEGKMLFVYVKLLNEGTLAFRPAQAERIDKKIVKLLPMTGHKQGDEEWEFPPGSIVRCENRIIEGENALVAVELHSQ